MEQELYKDALAEAKFGAAEGGIPIGAALFRGSQLIGKGHNLRLQSADPTAHAEISALRSAGLVEDYSTITLYTTYLPCFMCAGSVILFGIPRVVIGQSRIFPGGRRRSATETTTKPLLESRGIDMVELDDAETRDLLERYTAAHLTDWLKDGGEWPAA